MKRIVRTTALSFVLLAFMALSAEPAIAQKPSWAGKNKNKDIQEEASQQVPPVNRFYQELQGSDQDRDNRGRHGDHSRYQRDRGHARQSRTPGDKFQGYFSGRDRGSIDRYFGERFRQGKCPPGLRKKGNGCMPPGQARQWTLNRPLPPNVIFHDLPEEVMVVLGPPPPQHRFVRVAQDILLIAVGTGMVVDAIEDIGRNMNR
jgi:hypothetical protein